uniref:Centrosomin, isoform M n=2 Tax=Drosophila melanogaster TaxID=7227 RepID=A0A0B4K7N9_DROME|nr:centrosomin, isoform M [Drosophila melanogaster]NP_001246295.1 centrosomin, isoform N [Drosophila melanogaster]NP_725297.1 centrosomin, isoform B [Drosophila melanogaster]AAM68579.1 centrosomin, isoform B [Drosophila melanogaster]AFH08048.1 centrosomin, isoform M [Drosophila melanogaster]AFH08049.1 centrosomin, isoform N [Drosophila melanogaster]|eukprot:NP_001246294.1 centrosomin, isoform M [Drosophila melanogaster]
MAGIFRSTSLNHSSDVPGTPFKRYSLNSNNSTFCTSPGALQDVTMENSYASFDVPRPPGGGNSPLPSQGRSVRELEEQMSALRKENFNLKLRIYFLEEGQPGARADSSTESLSKQLIDAKIEIATLRKTVDVKMELLKDAARAISHHEELQRKADIDSQAIIDELQEQIHAYQMAESGGQPVENIAKTRKMLRLESEVQRLEEELVNIEARNVAARNELEFMLAERLESLTACEGKIQELAIKNSELVERLEKETASAESSNANRDLGAQLADKICELQEAQEKLKERERIHEQACRTIQKLMQKLSSQEKEIKKLNQENEQSANKENDCAKTVISPSSSGRSMSDNEASSQEMSTNLRVRYELKINEQEEKIKQLQTEVKKKTANLQNLVNKELWEKNREVERLTKLLANQQKTLPQISEESAGEADLQQSFTEAEYMRALERNKLLQRKVDVLFQRLADDQQNSAVIGQLRLELQQARTEVETADKWRLECVDVCSVLTNRLEELAGFLNSLLKHKDVLGVLAADRRNAMRKAVDRSLDLSKSLNMTLNITATSLADQSLAQLCNLSEILYTEGDASHKTFNSHEELHAATSMAPTVENLKAENKALKKELEKRRSSEGQRKERRSLPLPSQQFDNQSESEAWSEPDRKVSLARIGLDETSNSLAAPEQAISESESEGRTCATRQDRNRNSERIAQLEEQIAQKDERMLNVQCQMVELDNRYKQEQLRCLDITQQLEQLRAINEALTADLHAIGSHEEERMVELQRQLELKNQQIDQLKLAHSTLTADSQITEMELQALQQQMQEIEQLHADSVETLQSQLQKLKLDAVQQLEEHERLHREALERDWVALTTYQEQAQQLLELQRSLDYHQENEKELKQTLVENELATRALKKQLDESTLQASKAVMERTKAYNDKLQLEKRSEELRLQLEALKEEHQKLLQKRSNSSDVSQSGYTSEEVAVPMGPPSGQATTCKQAAAAVLGQRVNTSSPDLGIESDAGRISSVEVSNAQRAMLKTVEMKTEGSASPKAKSEESTSPDSKSNVATGAATVHDCAKVDLENAELRRKLIRTKRAFEDTYEKLRMANKAKAQVEKDIKNQILKTHNVLRNVRSNMENEL